MRRHSRTDNPVFTRRTGTNFLCLYTDDIFGFFPQTEQGSDILSQALSGTKVIMPDFLQGKPWPEDNFPPKTDEDKQKLQEFFGTT